MKRLQDQLKLLSPVVSEERIVEGTSIATRYIQDPLTLQKQIESIICQDLGSNEALLTTSGTSAIFLALRTAKIGYGDTVVCPNFTFAATVNAIRMTGANPIFVDSELLTWNMDPQLVDNVLESLRDQGSFPKAILFVHGYGVAGDILAFTALAKKYNICLIEDAAGALGTKVEGKQVGTFGDFGIISTNYNKMLTSFGGGILLIKNSSQKQVAYSFSIQGKDGKIAHNHIREGFNFQPSVISMGLIMSQWKDIPFILDEKAALAKSYRYYFREWSKNGVIVKWPLNQQSKNPELSSVSNHWLNVFNFEEPRIKKIIIDRLTENMIQTRPLWRPMHDLEPFSSFKNFENGNSKILFNSGIAFPSSLLMDKDSLDDIFDLLDGILKEHF